MKADEIPDAMKAAVPVLTLTRRRQANWLNPPEKCPCCEGSVRLVNNREIYGKSYGTWPYAYLCGGCGAAIGVHPQSIYPVGTLADKKLRETRQCTHDALEQMRRAFQLDVRQAHERLARLMGIAVAACRIATFDAARCQHAIAVMAADARTGMAGFSRGPSSATQRLQGIV